MIRLLLIVAFFLQLFWLTVPAEAQLPNKQQIDGYKQEQTNRALENQRLAHKFKQNKLKAKKVEKHYQRWRALAPLLSISFWLAIILIAFSRYAAKTKKITKDKMPTATKKSATTLIGGKKDPQQLAETLFNSLKHGSFNEYRLLLPSISEIKNYLPTEKGDKFIAQILNNDFLQNIFMRLTKAFPNEEAKLEKIETVAIATINAAAGKEPLRGINRATLVVSSKSGSKQLNIGSLVEFPAGWKIFVPQKQL